MQPIIASGPVGSLAIGPGEIDAIDLVAIESKGYVEPVSHVGGFSERAVLAGGGETLAPYGARALCLSLTQSTIVTTTRGSLG
jgi:hypothetical protein